MTLDRILHELLVLADTVNDEVSMEVDEGIAEFADRCEPREKDLEFRETRFTFVHGEMRLDTRTIV